MNGDIATAAAWRPVDRTTQQTNIALNEFDAAMHQALTENRYDLAGQVLVTEQLIRAKSRRRLRAMNIAIARVAAQLARIEGEGQ